MKKLLTVLFLLLTFNSFAADSKISALNQADPSSINATSKIYILTNAPLGSAWIYPSNYLDLIKTFDNWTVQFYSMVLSNLVGTVGKNVTNVVSLSTTNTISKPLTNSYINGIITLFGLEAGSGLNFSLNPSNIQYLVDWVQVASTTNVIGLSNFVNSVSNLVQTKQNGDSVLSNLVGTVGRNVTNFVSLSTTNVISKPLTNSYANGVLTFYGLEAGSGLLFNLNPSNIVYLLDWLQVASTTNVVGLSNFVNSVSNLTQTKLSGVWTQGVSVANPATNFNLIRGTNVYLNVTNVSGRVDIQINVPMDLTNIVYVNKDDNLSSAITNAPNNTVILVGTGNWTNNMAFLRGVHSATSSWAMVSKTNIRIRGVGDAWLWNTNHGDGIQASNCESVFIDGLNFYGFRKTNDTIPFTYSTIIFNNSKNCKVLRNNFVNSGDWCVSDDDTTGNVYQSTNIEVAFNTGFNCGSFFNTLGYDGGGVELSSFWYVHDNTFRECVRPIEFFGPSGPAIVQGSVVQNNNIINPISWAIWDSGQTNNYFHVIRNNNIYYDNNYRTVSSNTLEGAIRFTDTRGFLFEGNVINGPSVLIAGSSVGFNIIGHGSFRSYDLILRNNKFLNLNVGIQLNQLSTDGLYRGVKISGNIFSSLTDGGITVGGSDVMIDNNDLTDVGTSTQYPIWVGPSIPWPSTNIQVLNNRIRNSPGITSSGAGINIDSSCVGCRQFANDISSSYTLRIVDNGNGSLAPLTVEGVTGNATNRLVILGTNQAPVWYVDNRGFVVITNSTTNRVAAPTNTIAMGAESFGGFNLPNWTDHNGLQAALQPFIGNENIYWISTLAGTLPISEGVGVTTNGGTVISHTTPIETQSYMVALDTPASSNGCASIFSSADLANTGAHNGSSKIGGWMFAATWCSTNLIGQIVGGGAPRMFIGLTAKASEDYTNIVVTTNSTGQYIGLMCDSSQSTNMFFTSRDSGNEFRTNTGLPFIATNIYKLYMFNAPTSRFTYWRLDDAFSGATANGWFSNNVPTNFMKFGILTKNGTNRAHSIRFSRLYLQAPLAPPR